MLLNTKRFGEIEVSEDKIIHFKEGILGLEHLKRMVVIILEQTKPFYWLQAIDEDISLPVISPFEIDSEYSPVIDDSVFEKIHLKNESDLLVLSVAVIPDDIKRMTANLAAPILINIADNFGCQVLIEKGDYDIRYPIFKAVYEKMKGAK